MKIDVDVDNKKYTDAWLGFSGNNWHREINVRDFIQQNYQGSSQKTENKAR